MALRLHSFALAAAVVITPVGRSHPMHTAVAEITYDTGTRIAEIQIRLFADDLAAAVPGTPGRAVVDSAIARYVRGSFALGEPGGRSLPLQWVSASLQGDVVMLHLRAPAPGGLAGGSVMSSLLCERFEDQVNIVRASYAGRSSTLLFTPGDHAKALP